MCRGFRHPVMGSAARIFMRINRPPYPDLCTVARYSSSTQERLATTILKKGGYRVFGESWARGVAGNETRKPLPDGSRYETHEPRSA